MRKCPGCGSLDLRLIRSEIMCKKCGIVVEEGIFSGSRVV